MKKRLTALVMAFLLGLLLFHFRIPIPFMLSGIISASVLKFFVWTDMRWPVLWRNLGLMAAGYGIGRSFTHDTLVQMSQHVAGVFGASFVAIGISLLVAWFTYKHTFANLLSCIMGMLPGGLNQMMLMADEDPRAGVVISVPFLVIHLLGASVVPQGLLAPVGDNMGLTWLLMIPVAGIGSVVAKKLKVPTAALIGPIFATAAFSIICAVNLQKPPPILMNLAQLNIGLYMGCMLDKERLLRTRVLLPYAIIGTLLIIGGSIVVAEILVRYYRIGADVSIILTYQIVRLLMMNLTVPFILRRYFDDSYTG